jgi:hypothetical protein
MPVINVVCRKTGHISSMAYEHESRTGKSILTPSRRWLRTETKSRVMFYNFSVALLESENIKLKTK